MTAATTDTTASAVEFDDKAAARYLGVTVTWLQRQARAGRIAHTKVGRSYRFAKADLDEFLAARRHTTATPVPVRSGITGISAATAARHRRARRT